MKKNEYFLDENYQRPVIEAYNLKALIDTGAFIPVFSLDDIILKSFNAKMIKRNVEFGGFGGKCKGDIVGIKNFHIGEFDNSINFDYLEVIVPYDKYKSKNFPLIFSATMFKGLSYEINTTANKVIIKSPNLDLMIHRRFEIMELALNNQKRLFVRVNGNVYYENPETNIIENCTQFFENYTNHNSYSR